ncbi:hypothetical protein BG005_001758 [Podila minutissima]|nr:hypothetical protein BG005_001758 [Podila minutissima]
MTRPVTAIQLVEMEEKGAKVAMVQLKEGQEAMGKIVEDLVEMEEQEAAVTSKEDQVDLVVMEEKEALVEMDAEVAMVVAVDVAKEVQEKEEKEEEETKHA